MTDHVSTRRPDETEVPLEATVADEPVVEAAAPSESTLEPVPAEESLDTTVPPAPEEAEPYIEQDEPAQAAPVQVAPAEDMPQTEAVAEDEAPPQEEPLPVIHEEATEDPASHVSGASGEFDVDTTAVEAPMPQAAPLSLGARCFNGLAHAGWLVLLLLTAAMTAVGIAVRPLALPFDMSWNAVLSGVQQSGNWLYFTDGVVFYPEPPLYIWFLAGLGRLPIIWTYLPQEILPQVGVVLSLALCVLCTWLLARATGHTPRVALAAGCMLLISCKLAGFDMVAGHELLFTSLVLLSLCFLYRGWMASSAPFSLLAGFVLAAAATLTKSPIGMALPLLTSLVFLFWRGTFRRAGQRDGAFGFAVMLVVVVGWLTWLIITPEAKNYLTAVLRYWYVRDVSTLLEMWCLPAVALVTLSMPWPLLLLVLPWERIYRLPVLFWQNRHNAPGHGWIGWSLVVALGVLPFMAKSTLLATLPLMSLLAIAGAKAMMELTPGRSRLFFGLLGLLLLLVAGLAGGAALLPHVITWVPQTVITSLESGLAQFGCTAFVPLMPLLETVQGLAMVAGTSFVASLVLLKLTNKAYPAGGLLIFTLCVVAIVQPVVYLVLPSLF